MCDGVVKPKSILRVTLSFFIRDMSCLNVFAVNKTQKSQTRSMLLLIEVGLPAKNVANIATH